MTLIKPRFNNNSLIFCFILALGAFLRFSFLGMGYNSDEGWLLKTALYPLPRLFSSLEQGNSVYPWLSPILLHFWMKISSGEIWVRSYFVIFGLALCVLIYLIARSTLDHTAARIAMLLSAISPLLIWSSRFIRSYIDYAFWNVLCVYFLLLMIRQGPNRRNCLGYVLSGAAALYTSHLSLLIILSQAVFMLISGPRFVLKKWAACQLSLLALCLPVFGLLIKQRSLATAINPVWQKMGFEIFGLNVGYYARSLLALFGMDTDFFSISYGSLGLSSALLAVIALICASIGGWILFKGSRLLKKSFSAAHPAGLLICLVGVSFVVFNFILTEFMNFTLQPEYFLPQHALFILLLAFLAGKLFKRNRNAGKIVLCAVSLVYAWRIPFALQPQFDTKRAYLYLKENAGETACVLLAKPTNTYIMDDPAIRTVIVHSVVKNDPLERYQRPDQVPEYREVIDGLKGCHDIIFYRVYGNDEILGMNEFIMKRLRENGFKQAGMRKFKRIDLITYERVKR